MLAVALICNVLHYWRGKELQWPELCRMARVVLAVPAMLAGVERLFNIALDICHYRRGHLKPESTGKHVMMRQYDASDLLAESLENEEEETAKAKNRFTHQDLD